MKPSENILAAVNLIADRENWSPQWFGSNYQDNPADMVTATRHCALGAVTKVTGRMPLCSSIGAINNMPEALWMMKAVSDEYISISHFNRDVSHAEVVEMMYKAARLAKEAGE